MASLTFSCPILPGKAEAWRRFTQELMASRRAEYEDSRRRLGIQREIAWLSRMDDEIAIFYLEADAPERVITEMANSLVPFDRWFRAQLLELNGLDLTQPLTRVTNEFIFGWEQVERKEKGGAYSFQTNYGSPHIDSIKFQGEEKMSIEDNKALAHRWLEAFGKDMKALDEMLDANAVDLNPPPGLPANREGIKAQAALYGGAYPDLKFDADEIIAEGDRVMARWTAHGTHKSELLGIPPTGKTVNVKGVSTFRIVNGKVVETWTLLDQMSLLQQLGVAPAPAYSPR